MTKKHQILELFKQGKSTNEIIQTVGCAKSTVYHHCYPKHKANTVARTKRLREDPDTRLRHSISSRYTRMRRMYPGIPLCTSEEYSSMIFSSTHCCITGDTLNLHDILSWHVDHKVPVNRGGNCLISNLRVTTKSANMFKSDMLDSELIELAYKVINYLKDH